MSATDSGLLPFALNKTLRFLDDYRRMVVETDPNSEAENVKYGFKYTTAKGFHV